MILQKYEIYNLRYSDVFEINKLSEMDLYNKR